MATEKRLTAEVFCESFKRLRAGATKPVFLIVDNHPVHRSKVVKEFVESTEGMLKLFYLPPYSPELSPDEQVWNYVKNHDLDRQSVRNKKDFLERVMRVMSFLQKFSEKVKSFLRHPIIKSTNMFVYLCTA